MEPSFCISSSENNLDDARRYLETGLAFNWVPGSISSALHWAMEAWLSAHHCKVSRGNGWADTRIDFYYKAPKELRSEVMTCLSKTTYLQYDLEGGFNHEEAVPSISELEKQAYECLEEAEKAVSKIRKDVESRKGLVR